METLVKQLENLTSDLETMQNKLEALEEEMSHARVLKYVGNTNVGHRSTAQDLNDSTVKDLKLLGIGALFGIGLFLAGAYLAS